MVLKKAFDWMVMSDIYASAIAAGIAIIAAAVLGLKLDPFAIAAVFFTALTVYSLNRQDDGDIDAINIPERTRFVSKKGWMILVFSTAGFFALLTYAWLFSFQVFVIMASVYILGLFYSFPLLRPLSGILGFSRLKEPLGVKNLLISGMYGTFVLIPIVHAHALFSTLAGILFAFIFLRFFIVSTIFDMRDIEGDSKKNIVTIPLTFGKDTTLGLLHGLNLLTVLIGIVGSFFHLVSAMFGSMMLATFLFSLYYLEECRKEDADMRYLCSVVVEADFVPALAIAIPFLLMPFF